MKDAGVWKHHWFAHSQSLQNKLRLGTNGFNLNFRVSFIYTNFSMHDTKWSPNKDAVFTIF
jgi:hypothetical protein